MAANPNDYENTTRTVRTGIGELDYVGGYPTEDTVRRAYDQLDLQRATQVYLEFMPFMSQQAIFDSHEAGGHHTGYSATPQTASSSRAKPRRTGRPPPISSPGDH